MKKILICLTAVLLIAGAMVTSVSACEAEGKAETAKAGEMLGFNREQELISAKELAKKLEGQTVKITAQIGVDGQLFGSVTSKEIANAIESELSVTIDKRKIEAPEIKKCGTYDIKINLYTGVVCRMKAEVK